MAIIETVIFIGALAAGADAPNPTKNIYERQRQHHMLSTKLAHTQVPWLTAPAILDSADAEYARLLQAFREIGLPKEEGLMLLARAKEILQTASYPAVEVVPIISRDMEENRSYLTVQLLVGADLEKALELDCRLTEGMVAAFSKLPERLSFAVYEKETQNA